MLLLLATAVGFSPCGSQTAAPASEIVGPPLDSFTQAKLNKLKMMSYYPSANGWENMWTNWNPTTINSDFALIASLNANTVRIVVNVDAFGFPTPSSTMLSELSQIVTMAHSNGLQVQLTLFDWWSSYSSSSGSETWVSAVIGSYSNDSRVAFIELQNEIAPENAAAMSWAQTMLPYLQTTAGNIPVMELPANQLLSYLF